MPGLPFKENCPDLRNSRVIDIVSELVKYSAQVDVYDPPVDAGNTLDEYTIDMLSRPHPDTYDAVIIAVAHDQFRYSGAFELRALCKPELILYDVKYLLPAAEVDGRRWFLKTHTRGYLNK